MNGHRRTYAGVGFLCLLTGLIPAKALSATNSTTSDALGLKPRVKLVIPTLNSGQLTQEDRQKVTIPQPKPVEAKSLNFAPISLQSYPNSLAANPTASVKNDINPSFSPKTELRPTTATPRNPNTLSFPPSPQKVASASEEANQDPMDQVTSVSQLSDVQPTDWAFQALQSLVERYGCIAGYPDSTYRGNRALSRYEFAAGLNACLNRINELITSATSDLVRKEDITTLQRLQEEFTTELAALRGRVDSLEARAAQIEANQFSTTTKLSGEAIFAFADAGGGAPNHAQPNAILVDRVRLNLTTSFSGRDLLITGLQAYNLGGNTNSIGGSLGLGNTLGLSASSARLSFEPEFPGTNIQNLNAVGANSVQLYKLLYVFPVAKSLTLFAGPEAETTDAFPAITPFASEGQEAISRFAGYNPVVRISGGTSETGVASAAGFIFNPSKSINVAALYASVNASIPNKGANIAPGISSTPLGAGLFSGSSVEAIQLTLRPSKSLDIGLNYAHSYHEINILGTGLVAADIGSALPQVSPGTPVQINSVGGTLTWRFSPKIAFSTYGAALFVRDATRGVGASSTFTSWMVGLHFNDLFQEGNTAGLIFGQPLFITNVGGLAKYKINPDDSRATPYHLEAYYDFRVNDHISITPGAFVLFNPESNSKNDTTVVGVLRTTFSF